MRHGVRGVERTCRFEACGKTTFFDPADRMDRCPSCSAEYGVPDMVLDRTVFATPATKPLPKGYEQPAMKP